jgi:hypothetical protein
VNAANNQSLIGNWTNVGNWTIPTMPTITYESSYGASPVSQGLGLDLFSGTMQPILTYDQMMPQTYFDGDPWTTTFGTIQMMVVKYAKPNTQVWARNSQRFPFSHELEPDGTTTLRYIYRKPINSTVSDGKLCYNEPGGPSPDSTCYITTRAWEIWRGGWLMGTTDSNGMFMTPVSTGSGAGFNNISVYVGNHAGTYVTSLPDSEYVGSVIYYNRDSFGNPQFVPAKPY